MELARTEISSCLEQNVKNLKEILRADRNFDMQIRFTQAADRQACLIFVDGFIKDDIMEKLMEFFLSMKPEEVPQDARMMLQKFIPYIEVEPKNEMEQVITAILSGKMCILIDGFDRAFITDCRSYPVRSVQEPEKDKVLRGSRDGFVETLIFNTALIRRRIRSPLFTTELITMGEVSRTDIVLCYMEDRVDQNFLNELRRIMAATKVDALTMNQESLAECMYPGRWWNPFPKFRYTERPDTASSGILEGRIVILVDNSPSAMIIPAALTDILDEADDYYFPPVTGTYLRISRMVIALLTLFLTPLWLLAVQNPELLPQGLRFVLPEETPNIPIIAQLLILEFGIDGLKLAAVNTPTMLTTPLSVIAGIVVGEFAVRSGWFSSEAMVYMAFVAISNYTQSSFELGYALKFMRMLLLILTAIGNIWGFAAGVVFMVVCLLVNRSLDGSGYLYPLIPFQPTGLFHRLYRRRIHFRRSDE